MNKEELKEALKPIAQGLFGKNGGALYNGHRYIERPVIPLRPLEKMLADLVEIPFVDWYQYAFSRENLNGKFTDEQRLRWMEQSIECGKKYAEIVKKEAQTSDPVRIAKHMGMEVSYPDFPDKTDRVLFAEFREPNQIKIIMDGVKKAEVYLKRPEIKEVLTPQLSVPKLLLAHELFHAVEEKYKDEIFTKQEKIVLWSIGPIHYKSPVVMLSEIAAMAFAAELTRISYAPYVMDVFLMYGYTPEGASDLYAEMMELSGRQPCEGVLPKNPKKYL